MYRMATALAPYASHPELPQFHRQVDECADELAQVGALARELDIRLSTHPGQYTVLNSESEAVRAAAVAELEVQGALFAAMGLGPEGVVVVHVGGAAGGTGREPTASWPASSGSPRAARSRLVIENDDRVFGWRSALTVAERAEIPLVFDLHHHRCHDPDGIPEREALELALATWPEGVTPKVHFSSPRLDLTEKRKRVGRRVERTLVLPDLRLHADLIDPVAFRRSFAHAARASTST